LQPLRTFPSKCLMRPLNGIVERARWLRGSTSTKLWRCDFAFTIPFVRGLQIVAGLHLPSLQLVSKGETGSELGHVYGQMPSPHLGGVCIN
jgi:hypothetical protein